jgi:hypothetical protein
MVTTIITNFTPIIKKEQYSFDYAIKNINSKYNLNSSSMYVFKSDKFAIISDGTHLYAIDPSGNKETLV